MNEDKIIIVNKEADYTSRDVVNIISKSFNTKKVGHTGTLDPIASGVLVICTNKALKVVELLSSDTKEYVAEVILGYETDMLDITGKKIKEKEVKNITKEEIENVLKTFIGKIKQEVPLYSAVRVNGKRLYKYARSNEKVILPIREVEIYNIELLEYDNINKFKIKCLVSKGTYIRSLIRDIGYKLNNYATMTSLIRTKQGIFNIEDSNTIEDIKNNNYKYLSIIEALPNIKKLIVYDELLFKIKNGVPINNLFKEDMCFILDKDNNLISLYKKELNVCKPWKMF